MATDLDGQLRELIHEATLEAARSALEEFEASLREEEGQPKSWRSRIHRVHPETRLSLSDTAEALGVSERTVRRYTAGEGQYPALPSKQGPTGIAVRAGELIRWIEDVEGANRWSNR